MLVFSATWYMHEERYNCRCHRSRHLLLSPKRLFSKAIIFSLSLLPFSSTHCSSAHSHSYWRDIGQRNRVPFESTERFRYWMQLSNCMIRGNPFVKAHRKLLVLFQRIDVQQQFHNVIMLITTWVYISGIAHSTPCTLPISQSFALKHGTVQISLVVFLHFGPLLCKRPIAMPRLHGRASERCSCGVW